MSKRHAWLAGGLFKRIQVHHHHVDRLNPVRRDCCFMFPVAANIKQPAMYPRMQRLHPPIQHLGKPCQVADVLHRQPVLAQRSRRPPGRNQLHVQPHQNPRKIHQSCFVRNAQQRPTNLRLIARQRNRLRAHFCRLAGFFAAYPSLIGYIECSRRPVAERIDETYAPVFTTAFSDPLPVLARQSTVKVWKAIPPRAYFPANRRRFCRRSAQMRVPARLGIEP
uniref:Uncharacterized protein n=1 Tax=mine drainage metagenome TaxID=410659 RepID=E6PX09_9ZZZZ